MAAKSVVITAADVGGGWVEVTIGGDSFTVNVRSLFDLAGDHHTIARILIAQRIRNQLQGNVTMATLLQAINSAPFLI